MSDEAWLRVVGKRVQWARKKAGLIQSELAQRAGISVTGLAGIEHGANATSCLTMWRICDALDVPVDWVLRR